MTTKKPEPGTVLDIILLVSQLPLPKNERQKKIQSIGDDIEAKVRKNTDVTLDLLNMLKKADALDDTPENEPYRSVAEKIGKLMGEKGHGLYIRKGIRDKI